MRFLLVLTVLISFTSLSANNDDIFVQFEDRHNEEKYFEDGKKFYQNRDYMKAFENFEKSANYGNKKAMYNLGILYSNKNFVNNDPQKAFEIFSNLARDDYAPALNRIGMHYVSGIFVTTDYKKAIYYYEKASKLGNIEAQCNLSLMYASGKGVFMNYGRAHQFAKKGYEEGHPICKKVWDDFNLHKYPEDKGFKFNFFTKP